MYICLVVVYCLWFVLLLTDCFGCLVLVVVDWFWGGGLFAEFWLGF